MSRYDTTGDVVLYKCRKCGTYHPASAMSISEMICNACAKVAYQERRAYISEKGKLNYMNEEVKRRKADRRRVRETIKKLLTKEK